MIKASICTIGDEILIGQIVDTNSSHFAKALNSIGVIVTSMVSTSDNEQEIEKTIGPVVQNRKPPVLRNGFLKVFLTDLRGFSGTENLSKS